MGYKRGEHKGDAAIMLSNLYTNTTNTWLFYTAVGANAIGMALVEEMTGQSISWTGWLKATCIPAGIIVLLIPLITNFLFGTSKGEKRSIDIEFAKKKLEEMGPLTVNEKKAAIYFALTLLAFCTNGIHHVAPDYVVFVTIFLMLCPLASASAPSRMSARTLRPAFIQSASRCPWPPASIRPAASSGSLMPCLPPTLLSPQWIPLCSSRSGSRSLLSATSSSPA